jgi:murein DD-endopeptidase MepM/ murein hydrolase activator NlpD
MMWRCSDVKHEFLPSLLAHFESVAADLYIKLMENELAVLHLQNAIPLLPEGSLKTRAFFIIGQLYDNVGKYDKATLFYDSLLVQPNASESMKPYADVFKNLCARKIEKNRQDSIEQAIWSQKQFYSSDFEPSVVESRHDSSALGQNYPYYFSDDAAMFFLDETTGIEDETYDPQFLIDFDSDLPLSNEALDSIFENWDSIAIYLPNNEVRNMTDTVYLPLHTQGVPYTFPSIHGVFSRFGWRKTRYHYGVDTRNAMGDSIYCIFDGVVRIIKRSKTYGNVIVIRHLNGLETLYAHCSKILAEVNQPVRSGDLIALVGSTGRSTGPHLHLETRYKGVAFNPEYLIDFEHGKLVSDTLTITKELFNLKKKPSSSRPSIASSGNMSSYLAPAPLTDGYYIIRSGDTLSGIARKYRTSVDKIKRENGLTSDLIHIGQKLKIM